MSLATEGMFLETEKLKDKKMYTENKKMISFPL